MAKEELKKGKIYFKIMLHSVFLIILITFFIKNPSILFIIFIALLIIVFSLNKHRETLYYYALAVILFLSWKYNGLEMIASLIFLYSLPLSAIYLEEHLKQKKIKVFFGLLQKYIGFLILAIILGFIGIFF